jgi:hypothetical protein
MKLIIKRADGTIAIMYLNKDADRDDAFNKFKESHPEENFVDFFEYQGELPSSREFRNAWAHKGNSVFVDSVKAKQIHIDRIRHIRNQELDKLDKEHLQYLNDSAKLKELEDKKQILRDLPANINSLDWPDILPRRK